LRYNISANTGFARGVGASSTACGRLPTLFSAPHHSATVAAAPHHRTNGVRASRWKGIHHLLTYRIPRAGLRAACIRWREQRPGFADAEQHGGNDRVSRRHATFHFLLRCVRHYFMRPWFALAGTGVPFRVHGRCAGCAATLRGTVRMATSLHIFEHARDALTRLQTGSTTPR